MQTAQVFDSYVRTGLEVIPLYPGTKIPIGNGWNGPYDVARSRDLFDSNPKANMGVLLGRVVDVEGDTVEANGRLTNLIGGVEHPNYFSSKSHHHLFLNPDPFLTRVVFDDIEFRGHRHQSAIPPSVHGDGNPYRWLKGTRFPVPAMPKRLLDLYLERRGVPKNPLKPDHIKSCCFICGEFEYLHKTRLGLEIAAFQELGLSWACHFCRNVDVRAACRRIRKAPFATIPILLPVDQIFRA